MLDGKRGGCSSLYTGYIPCHGHLDLGHLINFDGVTSMLIFSVTNFSFLLIVDASTSFRQHEVKKKVDTFVFLNTCPF